MPQIDSLAELITRDKAITCLRAALILTMALVAVPLLRNAIARLSAHRLRPHQTMLLTRAVSWLGYGLAISSCLTTLGFDLGVLLGAAGVFTVAIGFAAQTSVSNLISGLFLLIEQPFSVGDQIQIAGLTGEILSIDLLSVKLRTADRQFVRLPNEMLLKSPVTNLTRFDVGGTTLEFAVAADQDLQRVRDLLLEVVREQSESLDAPAPLVHVTGYGDAGATLAVTFWASRPRVAEAKTQLFVRALQKMAAAGIALPAPQRRITTQQLAAPSV